MIDLFHATFVPIGGPLLDMSPQGCAVQCPACRRVYVEVLYGQFVLIASNALRSGALSKGTSVARRVCSASSVRSAAAAACAASRSAWAARAAPLARSWSTCAAAVDDR